MVPKKIPLPPVRIFPNFFKLAKVLRSLGIFVSEKDIAQLKEDYATKPINFSEFQKIAVEKMSKQSPEMLTKAFEVFDKGR